MTGELGLDSPAPAASSGATWADVGQTGLED